MEHCQRTPPAVPRWPYGMPDAEFYRQLPRRLPTVLHEPVKGGCDPWSLRLRADFGVLVEISERSIADRHSSRVRVARVDEAELATLMTVAGALAVVS